MPSSYDEVVVRVIVLIPAVLFVASACAPATSTGPAASTGPSASPTSSAPADGTLGLEVRPAGAKGDVARHWYTVPDGLFHEDARVAVTIPNVDAAPGRPRARLRSTGRTVDLTLDGAAQWTGALPLDGAAPGAQAVEFLVRPRDGTDAVIDTPTFMLSAPEYVVGTLDFEGDAAGDTEMANTAASAARL